MRAYFTTTPEAPALHVPESMVHIFLQWTRGYKLACRLQRRDPGTAKPSQAHVAWISTQIRDPPGEQPWEEGLQCLWRDTIYHLRILSHLPTLHVEQELCKHAFGSTFSPKVNMLVFDNRAKLSSPQNLMPMASGVDNASLTAHEAWVRAHGMWGRAHESRFRARVAGNSICTLLNLCQSTKIHESI